MNLVLRSEDGQEVTLDVDPEKAHKQAEAGAHKLYYTLRTAIDKLNKKTNEPVRERV